MSLRTRFRAWIARRYLAAVKRDIKARMEEGRFRPHVAVREMTLRLYRAGWGAVKAAEVASEYVAKLEQEVKSKCPSK